MKVKVCGITRPTDLKLCEKHQADLIGFINIKRSPRFVNLDGIYDLTSQMRDKSKSVLVMETEDVDEVLNAVKKTKIGKIQIYSINIDGVREIKDNNSDIQIIKAIGIPQNITKQKIGEIESYAEVCDFFLFDSEIHGQSGGTGKQIPPELAVQAAKIANKCNKEIKLILAGGINSQRIESHVKTLNKYFDYLDVNSGVENQPGKKDENKIKEFMQVMK